MSEKWTGKNTGFRVQVPHNRTALQLKNWLLENIGNLSFSRMESNDNKDNVTVKTFGNFQKMLYSPKKGKGNVIYEDAVEFIIGDPIQLTEFLFVADDLIANYQKLIEHADYFKNTFYPELMNYYDSWIGKVQTYTYVEGELGETEISIPDLAKKLAYEVFPELRVKFQKTSMSNGLGFLHIDSYWDAAAVYVYKKPYIDWVNSTAGTSANEGYNTYIESSQNNILILTALKLIVNYISIVISQGGFSIKTYGMKTPRKGLSGTQGLIGSSIWIDIKTTSPVTGFEINQDDTIYIRNIKRKVAAEGTYGTYRIGKPEEKPYYCWTYNNGSCGTSGTYGTSGWQSPEEHLEILVYVSMGEINVELINFIVEFKAAIQKADNSGSGGNTLYIIARNPEASAFGVGFGTWPNRQTLNFDMNFGQAGSSGTFGTSGTAGTDAIDLIKYPPEINYLVYEQPNAKRSQYGFYTTAGSHGTDGTMSVSLKGYTPKVPENFGATISPIRAEYEYGGWFIKDYGGLQYDPAYAYPDNFCRQFIFQLYQQGYDNLTKDYDVYFNIQAQLYNFSLFAALYYDHPVVTAKDVYSTKGSYPSSDLEEVNNYINNKYTYVADSSIGKSSDSWKILTEADDSGDCEDFALTKLQKLLEYGWPVSKLHLECGIHVDEYGNRTGHVWLVAEADNGTYVLDNGSVSLSLTTRETMQAIYNKRKLYQVSGMTWLAIDSSYEVTIEKPDTIPINSKLLAFKARFLRRYREEGSTI